MNGDLIGGRLEDGQQGRHQSILQRNEAGLVARELPENVLRQFHHHRIYPPQREKKRISAVFLDRQTS